MGEKKEGSLGQMTKAIPFFETDGLLPCPYLKQNKTKNKRKLDTQGAPK